MSADRDAGQVRLTEEEREALSNALPAFNNLWTEWFEALAIKEFERILTARTDAALEHAARAIESQCSMAPGPQYQHPDAALLRIAAGIVRDQAARGCDETDHCPGWLHTRYCPTGLRSACDCPSLGGRFGAHRSECPAETALAARQSDPDATERVEWGEMRLVAKAINAHRFHYQDIGPIHYICWCREPHTQFCDQDAWADHVADVILIALANRAAKPVGTERVEWGMDFRDGHPIFPVMGESAARSILRDSHDALVTPTLVRRTVTTGEWTEVGE